MVHRSQILIITDRKRVFGEDTDMITVLSLCSQWGDTPAIIDALEACRKHGLKHLDYYPGFVRIISRAFTREDDEYEEPESGIMPYSIDADKGMSFLKSRNDLLRLVYSDQPYLPVIDLTGYEYDGGEEPPATSPITHPFTEYIRSVKGCCYRASFDAPITISIEHPLSPLS